MSLHDYCHNANIFLLNLYLCYLQFLRHHKPHLYIFNPLFEDDFFVFKDDLLQNSVLSMYSQYSRMVCNQEWIYLWIKTVQTVLRNSIIGTTFLYSVIKEFKVMNLLFLPFSENLAALGQSCDNLMCCSMLLLSSSFCRVPIRTQFLL